MVRDVACVLTDIPAVNEILEWNILDQKSVSLAYDEKKRPRQFAAFGISDAAKRTFFLSCPNFTKTPSIR